jgi:hypothetical protein
VCCRAKCILDGMKNANRRRLPIGKHLAGKI